MFASLSVAISLVYSERCSELMVIPLNICLGWKTLDMGDRDTWRLQGWRAWLAPTEVLAEHETY